MATHNGERFLAAQLDSILRQTLLPDGLVVHDDCSEDGTVRLVQEFARSAPFPVELIRATRRGGYADGFLSAARSCHTDLVSFSDQDDVWKPKKLERCVVEFERSPDVILVAHSWELLGAGRGARRSLLRLHRRRVTNPRSTPLVWPPGFGMVISRRLLEVWDWVGQPSLASLDWGHDDWFSFVAAALGTVVFLPDRLVLYRQHDANLLGAPAADLPGRVRGSVACRGAEARLYWSLAAWARAQVDLLQALQRDLPHLSVEFDPDGPLARVPLWQHLAEVNQRRGDVYGLRSPGIQPIKELVAHALRGDYGPRTAAGLGLSSLVRDGLHACGLLDRVSGAVGRPASFGG